MYPHPRQECDVHTDLYARDPRDLSRIDVLDPYEVRYWTTRLGCAEHALRSPMSGR